MPRWRYTKSSVAHDKPPHTDHDQPEGPLAVRRHTDRCFFEAEEVVHDPSGEVAGYIVEGILWDVDDVAEVRPIDDSGVCGT